MERYDSIVNSYLIQHCALHPPTSPQIALVVHSASDSSSVTYEIAVFERGLPDVKAVGSLVHVFVDRGSNRPAALGMDPDTRRGLERLLLQEPSRL